MSTDRRSEVRSIRWCSENCHTRHWTCIPDSATSLTSSTSSCAALSWWSARSLWPLRVPRSNPCCCHNTHRGRRAPRIAMSTDTPYNSGSAKTSLSSSASSLLAHTDRWPMSVQRSQGIREWPSCCCSDSRRLSRNYDMLRVARPSTFLHNTYSPCP